MAEIIFVNPYPENAYGINEGTVEPPLGIGYLAAIAEENNVSCKIIDANVLRIKADDLFSEIKKYKPKIIGISLNLYSYQVALKLADKIKEFFSQIDIILGGPTPSSMPFKTINACKADAVVIGEGEETFREIIDKYKKEKPLFKDVNGLVYKDRGKIVKNNPREFIRDINQIPFPAYHLFPDLSIYKSRARKSPTAPLLTSRGCPYQCVFCSKDVFKNVCRMRSPENVIREIDMLVKRYGVKQIDILDDNFTMNKKRTERILDLIAERNYDLIFNLQSGARIENLDSGIISKMRRAKIWKVSIGIESGDCLILKQVKKRLDLNRALEIAHMIKKAGIELYGFFMIGLPGDTAESMQKTIDFAINMDPDIANFCITIPFPGTELYDRVKNEGKFLIALDDGINTGFYANEVFYEIGNMDKKVVLKYYRKAIKDFYFRPHKILRLLTRIKSKDELKWFFDTGFSIIKNLWMKSKKAQKRRSKEANSNTLFIK